MSCPLSYTSLNFCSLVLIIVIHLSLGCRNMVLHILSLIPQLILSWAVYLTINLMLYPSLLSLCRLWCLIPWVCSLPGWFYDLILIFLIVFWISSCWTNIWMVKYILESLLNLLDLIPFLIPVILFLGCPLVVISCFWKIYLNMASYNFLVIL